MGRPWMVGRKGLLFLKKKKQKDFYKLARVPGYESFLVLFFKKEPLS
jgi:hypothetical protein